MQIGNSSKVEDKIHLYSFTSRDEIILINTGLECDPADIVGRITWLS